MAENTDNCMHNFSLKISKYLRDTQFFKIEKEIAFYRYKGLYLKKDRRTSTIC